MKEIVDRARQLSRTMAGRLRRAVDPPLASDAAPLEIRHFIIESIESRVQPSGGGRRKLPDALVDVKMVAADAAAQRALRTALDAGLCRIDGEEPAGGDAVARLAAWLAANTRPDAAASPRIA